MIDKILFLMLQDALPATDGGKMGIFYPIKYFAKYCDVSMAFPVVTTPEGAEGIGADKHILQIANSDEDYANKVIELIKNSEKNYQVGKKFQKIYY